MSVNINMNVASQHFTANTSITPPNSLQDRIVFKSTGKSYRLNALNRKRFKANPKQFIQPSNKFYDKFSGRFKIRNNKNVGLYENKLDNEIHLYTVKYNKYQVNKKYNDYIIPSGHTTKNLSVYSKRKDLAKNILAKQVSINEEVDENDPYATQYAIDEFYESDIVPTMNTQGQLYQDLDFIADSDDEDGNDDSNFEDDAYDMFGNNIKYDNKWFDYDFEKDDNRCVWNYLKYYHNITDQYISKISGKSWDDNEGLTVNDIYKIAKHRGTPLIVLDLCYNVMKDNNGKLMKYNPKEEDRRHSKYFVFIKANHHIYPFTTKTQRAIINKKLAVNKSFMERNERGKAMDKHTQTIKELEEIATEEGEEQLEIFKSRCKIPHIITDKKNVSYKDLLEKKIGLDGEEYGKAINFYVADATDLNDIYLDLFNNTGMCYKYTANDGLITSITSYSQDKEVIDGLKINTEYGEATGDKFSIFCNTNATITKDICNKYDIFYHNDSLSGVGKRIYNLDKKFKHLCSDYLESPLKIKKPLNQNGIFIENLTYKGYDINKCYSSLLETPLFEDGWEKFEIFDNIEKYDGDKKKNGWFYTELHEYYENNLLMNIGAEWCSYSMLCEMDKRDFKYMITHQYYPHIKNVLKKNHFKEFVNNSYDKCGGDAKHIINSFVGQLGKHKQKKRCVKSVMVNSLDDVSYYTNIYNNLDVIQLGSLYMLNFYKIEDNRSNGLPIHNKIIEMGRLKLQKLYEDLGGEIDKVLLIKTDMIVYGDAKNIEIGSGRGEIKLENLNYDKDDTPIYEISKDNFEYFMTNEVDCMGNDLEDELDEVIGEEKGRYFRQDDYIKKYAEYKDIVFKWWCETYKKAEWIILQGNTGLSFTRFFDKDNKDFKECPFFNDYPSEEDYYGVVGKKFIHPDSDELPEPEPEKIIDHNCYTLDLLSNNYGRDDNEVEAYNSKYLDSEWSRMEGDQKSYDKLIECGGFLTGYAGSGKSYQTVLLYKKMIELGKKPCLTATTNKAKANDQFVENEIDTSTIHSVLGHLNPKTFDKEYRWVKDYTHLIIDECSMIDKGIYYHLRNIKVLYPHLKIIFIGDYQQLPAVDFDAVYHDLEGTQFLKWIMNNNYVRLNKCMRTLKDGKPDDRMWNICKSILDDSLRSGDLKKQMDHKTHKDTLINLCWTNKKKEILNGKSVFSYFRKKVKADPHKKVLQTKLPFCKNKEDNEYFKGRNRFFWASRENYNGTYVVATKNTKNYYNNQTFFISKIGKDGIVLKDSVLEDTYITIDEADFLKHFDYSYCMTAHRSQGSTIRCAYTIQIKCLLNHTNPFSGI